MSDAIQITTTTGSRELAERIAYELVSRRLAACVQITGPAQSTYRWQGNMEIAREEWLCVAKTTLARYPAAEAAIREIHTYEQPEIIAVPICAGSEGYLAWLRAEVSDQPEQPTPDERGAPAVKDGSEADVEDLEDPVE